ncbi:MAG: hypothetical protein LBQ44_00180 [Treponema sp.]|jgi:hypothetical protein|nr:hypothetical protein [Treponema sp.]
MKNRIYVSLSFCALFALAFVRFLNAQGSGGALFGDPAVARRYLVWAENEIRRGRWEEALAGLERGADYGDFSSDISYLLALARSSCGKPRGAVLEALRRGLETDRWDSYTPEAARIMEAKILTELKQYDAALLVLRNCDQENYDAHYWKLRALKGLSASGRGLEEFRRSMALALDRFPRYPGPARILFEYVAGLQPPVYAGDEDRELIALVLKRLSLLLEADPELAYLAVPFIRDTEEARSLTAAYRSGGLVPAFRSRANPASLPAALMLGLVSDDTAVEEFFAPRPEGGKDLKITALDKALILALWENLRGEEGRELFRRNLSAYSGLITEDADGDGIADSVTGYRNGLITEYSYDADQDGLAEWLIAFAAGVPQEADIVSSAYWNEEGTFAVPVKDQERPKARLQWERYPAVLHAELGGRRYIPRPLDYFFSPLRFVPLVQGGPLYPVRDEFTPLISELSLLSFAAELEQPSEEFPGAVERVELQKGIPVQSRVYLGGRMLAETEFSGGRPLRQRADLDADGRMETVRHFSPDGKGLQFLSESDWDGDGVYEYAESLGPGGELRKFWDLDGDGIRETER